MGIVIMMIWFNSLFYDILIMFFIWLAFSDKSWESDHPNRQSCHGRCIQRIVQPEPWQQQRWVFPNTRNRDYLVQQDIKWEHVKGHARIYIYKRKCNEVRGVASQAAKVNWPCFCPTMRCWRWVGFVSIYVCWWSSFVVLRLMLLPQG